MSQHTLEPVATTVAQITSIAPLAPVEPVTSGRTGATAPVLVSLPDRFDVHQVHWLDGQVSAILKAGNSCLIDASAVKFLDCWAIEALLATKFRCIDAGRSLEFLALSRTARLTLELTGHLATLLAS